MFIWYSELLYKVNLLLSLITTCAIVRCLDFSVMGKTQSQLKIKKNNGQSYHIWMLTTVDIEIFTPFLFSKDVLKHLVVLISLQGRDIFNLWGWKIVPPIYFFLQFFRSLLNFWKGWKTREITSRVLKGWSRMRWIPHYEFLLLPYILSAIA